MACTCVQVSAANYEARRFKIKAGMTIAEARRLCPHVLVVPYMFDKYQAISEQVGSHNCEILAHKACRVPQIAKWF